jgi:hypothetical protein
MREAGAEVGVIVTTSYPAGWSSGQLFGLHDEVWVTSASAAIPLAAALRERGWTNLRYVDGGMSEWVRRGWKTVRPAAR